MKTISYDDYDYDYDRSDAKKGEAALKVKKRCKIKTCLCEVNF